MTDAGDTIGLLRRLTDSPLDDPEARRRAEAALFAHVQARLEILSRKMLDGYPRLRARLHETGDVFHGAVPDLIRSLEAEPPRDARHFFRKAARSIRRELARLARSEGRLKRDASLGPAPGGDDPSDAPDVLAEWTEFHESVERLDDAAREVVEHLWYGGLTQSQTAELMGISEPTVRARWRDARNALRDALGGRLPGLPHDREAPPDDARRPRRETP